LSNIHDVSFEDLCAAFPGYFDIFDGCHIVRNNDPALRKPAAAAFDSCKALIAEKHPNRPIIFVDDKKSNIIAGQQAGLMGITFSSAQQLEKELARHNIFVH
jgi:FMN phosphatase YigB (HAD superfamily)